MSITQDEDYYLRSSIFLVEDTLFKLPTYMVESQSCVFATLFTLEPPSGELEGQTDDLPIRLNGVKKNDFRCLLKVLYPKKFGTLEELSKEEWLAVLELSTQWAMDGVHAVAIQKLSKALEASPYELINIGKRYHVGHWIFCGVEKLLQREEHLGEEDVTALGIEEVLRLAASRERVLRKTRGCLMSHVIRAEIKATYGVEKMEDESSVYPLSD